MRFISCLLNYNEQGKPKALLYTIARNLCINQYKKIRPLSISEIEDMTLTSSGEDEIETIESKIVLGKYLSELPPEQQETLLLRYSQDLQVNEIARVMGISRFTVMYRLKTAVNTLRKQLDKEDFN